MREEKKDRGWKRNNLNYRRKKCPFESGAMKIDYKDPRTLQVHFREREDYALQNFHGIFQEAASFGSCY